MAEKMLSYGLDDQPHDVMHALYRGRNTPITIPEALSLLEKTTSVKQLPFRPQGGEVFLIEPQQTQTNDWKADGHRWSNEGTTKLPRSNPVIAKPIFI